MPTLPLYDIANKKVGTVDLDDRIFAGTVRPHLWNDAVRAQVAWHYEWKTANSRTRTEVTGTRKKIYKQKGTGQARHGDKKAPTFVGGGKAHGPRPRLVRHKINKKVMRAALLGALTARQKEDRIFVIDKLELEKPASKSVAKCLEGFQLEKALIVNVKTPKAENFNRSLRNIKGVKLLQPDGVNVFDLLKYPTLVISRSGLERLTERLNHV